MSDHDESGDHQPNEDVTPAAGAKPSETPESTSTGDKTVPLNELVKMRQAASEAKKAKEAADAQIKELQDRLAESEKKREEKPAPKAERKEDPDPSKLDKLDEILRKEAIRDLQSENGLTFAQAEKIHEMMSKMPDLDFEEAHALAASRNIDVFSEDGRPAAGYNPATHGATRPRPGSQPPMREESDMQSRLKAIRDTRKTHKATSKALFNNLVGSIAAKQLGREGHQRMKIPKT